MRKTPPPRASRTARERALLWVRELLRRGESADSAKKCRRELVQPPGGETLKVVGETDVKG